MTENLPVRLRRLGRALFPVLFTALAVAACDRPGGAGAGFEVRDSAGVIITQNTAPAWPQDEGWRLSDAPSLDIGVLAGTPEEQLYQVRGAVRLVDGRIVVANAGSSELRFYSRDGAHLASVGRQGAGPGEFQAMGAVYRLGLDSLMVWDNGTLRVSVLDTAGSYVRAFQLGRPLEDTPGWLSVLVGLFGDGTLLANAFNVVTCADVQEGVCRDPRVYLRYDRDGVLLDSLGRFPGTERFVTGAGDSRGVTALAFGRTPDIAPHGESFYYGSGEAYEVGYYGLDGALRRLIRKTQPAVPVTESDIDRYEQRVREIAPEFGPAWMQHVDGMLREMPYPETMPAYSGLEVDAEGNLWVREYGTSGAPTQRWSVFEADGRLLGAVAMPAEFSVYEIGADYVLGRWTDELDVEHVQLYALIKS